MTSSLNFGFGYLLLHGNNNLAALNNILLYLVILWAMNLGSIQLNNSFAPLSSGLGDW